MLPWETGFDSCFLNWWLSLLRDIFLFPSIVLHHLSKKKKKEKEKEESIVLNRLVLTYNDIYKAERVDTVRFTRYFNYYIY